MAHFPARFLGLAIAFALSPLAVSYAAAQDVPDLLGAEIGDLDISGDNLADGVRIVPARIDWDNVDLTAPSAMADMPWIMGRVEIVDIVSGNVHCAIEAMEMGDRLGKSVSATTDFNLDGVIDLLIGASGANVYGRVYVFYGPFADGAVLTADDANMILTPAHEVDHEYGHMVAPLADVTGDSIPEIRIRSARGALIEQRFITHIHDGATGEHLAAIRDPDMEDMWLPIEGDLNDDGDVDIFDQFRLLAQFGRTADTHRVWADVDIAGTVGVHDFILQYLALGEHPGLDVGRNAVAVMTAGGPADCSCPPGVPPDCCVYNQFGEVECCDGGQADVHDCIKELPHLTSHAAAIADCENSEACGECFDDWYEWLRDLMNAGSGSHCDWPMYPNNIHFVNCADCEHGSGLFGFHQDGTIWICINKFLNEENEIDADKCVELKKTMLHELAHAVQHCYLATVPDQQADWCLGWTCREIQSYQFFDCMGDPNPCICGLSKAISGIAWRASRKKLTLKTSELGKIAWFGGN